MCGGVGCSKGVRELLKVLAQPTCCPLLQKLGLYGTKVPKEVAREVARLLAWPQGEWWFDAEDYVDKEMDGYDECVEMSGPRGRGGPEVTVTLDLEGRDRFQGTGIDSFKGIAERWELEQDADSSDENEVVPDGDEEEEDDDYDDDDG